jgi:hypothetical protein
VVDSVRLRVRPEFVGAVGYADIYECQVVETLEGAVADDTLSVTVLASDHELGALMGGDGELELAFAKDRENEPRALTPISGFVDRNGTSWRITEAREAT